MVTAVSKECQSALIDYNISKQSMPMRIQSGQYSPMVRNIITGTKVLQKLEASIALGKTIKVFAKIIPDRLFPVKIQEFVPGIKIVWRRGMPLRLFKGIRTFTLAGTGNGPIEFRIHEKFSGLMSPHNSYDAGPKRALRAVCNKLKPRPKATYNSIRHTMKVKLAIPLFKTPIKVFINCYDNTYNRNSNRNEI